MVKRKQKVVYRYRTKRRSTNKAKPAAGFLSGMGKPLGAMAYGAIREKTSTMIANSAIGQKLPATEFTDEAVMLGTMFLARKVFKPKGLFASIIRNGETVEYARVGQTLVDVFAKKQMSTSNGLNYWN
jgi:hypothetical protein